ncbi:aldo/keto reductase [Clostridiales bacterium COT073_COT-073]|nr:aldo/keto reductase [Clostridiales bacterium COT073_COT-073]
MKYVRVGQSGLKITELTFGSALTIGTENLSIEYASSLIDKAWELGIRSFDLSNNYGDGKAEELVMQVLKKYPRQEYVISTKGSWPVGDTVYHMGLSRKHILWAFEESLKRMKVDYMDIYYAHRYYDDVPMEEIVRTFNYLIQTGKVRYWATSEWPVHALQNCLETCERLGLEKPILEQSFYSFAVEKVKTNGVKQFCEENGIGLLGFGTLAQGVLTGKYRNGIPKDSRIAKSEKIKYSKTINIYEQNKERIDKFLELCEEYSTDSTAVALQWSIKNKIYPVIGASKPEQLESCVLALEDNISEELWKKLEQVGD